MEEKEQMAVMKSLTRNGKSIKLTWNELEYLCEYHNIGFDEIEKLPGFENYEIVEGDDDPVLEPSRMPIRDDSRTRNYVTD